MRGIISILFITVYSLAWANTPLTVSDSKSNKAIPGVHICTQTVSGKIARYYVTDDSGKCSLIIQGPMVLVASAIGYQTYVDTLDHVPEHIKLEPECYSMDEVVVTGQPEPTKIKNSTYSIRVINMSQMATKANNDLKDILKDELNIRIVEDLALGSGIQMQGLSGEYVKYMIDGVPIIGRLGGEIDLTQINLQDVERIEIIEGPMSVLYGSDALAGTINIITKSNHQKRKGLEVSQYGESVGVSNSQASFTLGGENHKMGVSGGFYTFGGYRFNDELERGYNWKPKNKINSNIFYASNIKGWESKINGSLFKEKLSDLGETNARYIATDKFYRTSRYDLTFNTSKQLAPKINLELLAAYNEYDRKKETWIKDMTSLSKNLSSGSGDQDTTKFGAYMVRSAVSIKQLIKQLDILTGIEFRNEDTHGQRIENKEQSMQNGAAFLSVIFKPTDYLQLQPGTRYIYNSAYEAPLVYSLNVKAEPFENVQWRTSYAVGFRAPSLKELYYEFVDSNHQIFGNSELKAETSDNLSTNFSWTIGTRTGFVELSTGAYYNNIDNRISLAKEAGTTNNRYFNIDNITTKGFNASAKYKLNTNLSFNLAISQNAISNDYFNEDDGMDEFIWSNDLIFNARYLYRKYNIEIATYYKLNGKRPRYYYSEDSELYQLGYQGTYHTLDVNIKKSFRKNKFQLIAGANNLLNNINIEQVGDTGSAHSSGSDSYAVGWGRTFFLKLSYQLKKY